jgi:hypothetical protein
MRVEHLAAARFLAAAFHAGPDWLVTYEQEPILKMR